MTTEPIFKLIFGNDWNKLSLALQKRYANCEKSNDEVIVKGILQIHVSTWIKLLSPFLRLCGALVPYAGKDISVTVCFNSNEQNDHIGFNRTFYYSNEAPYQFRSKLVPWGKDRVVEFMRFGLGWRMRYWYDGEKVRLDHDGYIWHYKKITIPLPLSWILGKGYATESPMSDNRFSMYFEIIHPLFGDVFGYQGEFEIDQSPFGIRT